MSSIFGRDKGDKGDFGDFGDFGDLGNGEELLEGTRLSSLSAGSVEGVVAMQSTSLFSIKLDATGDFSLFIRIIIF